MKSITAPIAVFDSGIGGIGVLRELKKALPGESFLYFGDCANAPYGEKPPEKIREMVFSRAARLFCRAKALVLTAIHDCVDSSPNACYFPAYEILNDELRDYRFYREDMLHPNELAYSILTRTFVSACFGEEGLAMLDEAEKRERRRRHVPGGLN